eukprot:scaffold8275_cov21-Tisochrysis_lutea.AAC.1
MTGTDPSSLTLLIPNQVYVRAALCDVWPGEANAIDCFDLCLFRLPNVCTTSLDVGRERAACRNAYDFCGLCLCGLSNVLGREGLLHIQSFLNLAFNTLDPIGTRPGSLPAHKSYHTY